MPLALLRTLVVIEFARGRELLLLWLVVPAVAFAIGIWAFPAGMSMLAGRFAVFSMLHVCVLCQRLLACAHLAAALVRELRDSE